MAEKPKRVHFLHGVAKSHETGTVEAKYVFHYADGATRERTLVAGVDLLDLNDTSPQEAPTLSVAWNGRVNNFNREEFYQIRLYRTTWENPLPGVEIVNLDFVSVHKETLPFLIAVTLE